LAAGHAHSLPEPHRRDDLFTVGGTVADLEIGHHVGIPVGVQAGRLGAERGLHADHRGQFLELKIDKVGGVHRRPERTRHNDRERLPDIADHLVEHRVRRLPLPQPRLTHGNRIPAASLPAMTPTTPSAAPAAATSQPTNRP
jgi:hypothetical protein